MSIYGEHVLLSPTFITSLRFFQDTDLGSNDGAEATYVQCGKCKSVYPMDLDALGRGKKLTCSLCEHAWWQTADRLQSLRSGWLFEDLPDDKKSEIKSNIAAGNLPVAARPLKKKGAITIFIGNCPFDYVENDIVEMFAVFGEVCSVNLVTNLDGSSKGFAFVEMQDKASGEKAIYELHETEINGRALNVALGGNRD